MSTPSKDDLDALLGRVASGTQALRTAPNDERGREMERALLEDLTRVAAMLRADAAAIGESLARVLESGAAGANEAGEQP